MSCALSAISSCWLVIGPFSMITSPIFLVMESRSTGPGLCLRFRVDRTLWGTICGSTSASSMPRVRGSTGPIQCPQNIEPDDHEAGIHEHVAQPAAEDPPAPIVKARPHEAAARDARRQQRDHPPDP